MVNTVEKYWSGVARRLQEEVDTFNKLIGHAGEQGRENELSLVRLMENLLPSSVGIGSGMIIDSVGGISKQTDIIIYDAVNQPAILAQTTQVIYPVENVHLAIEVKTTLDEDELKDCSAKKESISALSPADGRQIPPLVVLSYHAESMASTVARDIRAISPGGRPDLLCVVNPGIIAGLPGALGLPSSADYVIGLAALHKLDTAGARIASDWDLPTDADRGATAIRGGLPYPMARTGRRNDERYLGEPGRALLLFCASLIDLLGQRAGLPAATLKHYLQGPARELLAL